MMCGWWWYLGLLQYNHINWAIITTLELVSNFGVFTCFISLSVFQNYVAVWIYCWYFLLFLFLATFLLCIEQLEFPGPQVIKVLFVCSFLYCRFTDIFWSKILRLHQQYCTQKLLSSRLKLFLSLKSCLIIDQQHEEGDE